MTKLLFNSISLISGFIVTNTVIQNHQVAFALTSEQVNNIALKIVVGITGTNQASGVIISKNQNNYGVLTTWNNVKKEGNYNIVTSDGQSYLITKKKQIPGADLAIVYFNSEQKYMPVRLGNSKEIESEETFYLAGYSFSPQDREKPKYRFYDRKLVQVKSETDNQEGYSLIYNGAALPGMAGSAILNSSGRLIGLYGKTEINPETLQSNLFGIPINTLEKLARLAQVNLERPSSDVNLPQLPPDEKLISQTTKIDYNPLRNFLAAEKWKQADITTLNLMLTAVNREQEGWFIKENIEQFPCDDLEIIDSLWSEHSGNRFGLKIQEKIYLETGNKLNNYDLITFRNFGENIGWRDDGEWLSKDNLIYNENAPIGHLPASLPKRLGVYLGVIFSTCKL